jgi:hypothetical protein
MLPELEPKNPSTWRLAPTFAWIFTAACVVLLGIAAIHYYTAYRSERLSRETSERVHVDLVEQVIVGDIASVATDLMVLTRHIEQLALSGDLGIRDPDLEPMFVIFAEQKRLYDQIRFLNTEGWELLRVNYARGRARVVPAWELQDKSGRYYFTDALALKPGEVYIYPERSISRLWI